MSCTKENDSNYFNGKPFKLVLDSLYGLKNKLKSYRGPTQGGYKLRDTLFTKSIIIYLGDENEAPFLGTAYIIIGVSLGTGCACSVINCSL